MQKIHLKWLLFLVSVLVLFGFKSFLIDTNNSDSQMDAELLIKNVPDMMKDILKTHLTQKKMTDEIMKRMTILFINQFDPSHSYFLEDEVLPYFYMPKLVADRLVEDYKNGDFSFFLRLNKEIQQRILRAREIRSSFRFRDFSEVEKILKKPYTKYETVKTENEEPSEYFDAFTKPPFPKTINALETKMRYNFCSKVMSKERESSKEDKLTLSQLCQIVEDEIEYSENQYLGAADEDISSSDEENYFVYHLMKAFTASLDAHTNFLNINEANYMKKSLQKEFEGLGLTIQSRDKAFFVFQILENSPAAKSNKIKVEDELIEVGNVSVKGLNLEDVIEKMQGKVGTSIDLKLKRKNEIVTVRLERQKMVSQEGRVDLSSIKIGDGIIGIITLHSFYQGPDGISSSDDIKRAIKKFQHEAPLKGIILDLRANRGGFLLQAVKVAGLFIKSGVIVISKTNDGDLHYLRDLDSRIAFSGPLIILTSRMTASAAEIVAQSLQDYGEALIVGDEQTYGKGSIQMQTVTEKNSGNGPFFVVTIGRYYSVSGKSTQIDGVKADIVVPSYYYRRKIGEAFLRFPLPRDTVAAAFSDQLIDVEPELKDWCIRYYVPYLQKPSHELSKLVPELRKLSFARVKHNKKYQELLKEAAEEQNGTSSIQDEMDDLQLNEAVDIMKDLIQLEGESQEKEAS